MQLCLGQGVRHMPRHVHTLTSTPHAENPWHLLQKCPSGEGERGRWWEDPGTQREVMQVRFRDEPRNKVGTLHQVQGSGWARRVEERRGEGRRGKTGNSKWKDTPGLPQAEQKTYMLPILKKKTKNTKKQNLMSPKRSEQKIPALRCTTESFRLVYVGVGWLWQGPPRLSRLREWPSFVPSYNSYKMKWGLFMSSTGEIQRKGFLRRRCWKLLDGRDPFPGTRYGPGHKVGAQQTRLPQRGLVLGHPSAHGPCGETQKKEPSCLQPGGTRQWRARDAPAVCSFIHSFIQTRALGIYAIPAACRVPGVQYRGSRQASSCANRTYGQS